MRYSHLDIGKHVAYLRTEKGWSAYQLSLASGISNSVLTRLEKGEREPMLNTLLKVIEGLDLSPAEFFKAFK